MDTISRNKKPTSIKWRFLSFVIILAVAFFIATVMTSRILESNLLEIRVFDSAQKVNDISTAVTYDFVNHNSQSLYNYAVSQGLAANGRILLLDSSGIVQLDSYSRLNGTKMGNLEIYEVLEGDSDVSYGYHRIRNGDRDSWTLNSVSAIIDGSKTVGAAVLVQSIDDVVSGVNSVRIRYIIIYLVSLAIVVILFWLIINRILSPLKSLQEGTEAISEGDLNKRVEVRGRDELASLGNSFNEMAQKLEDVDRIRSEFVSNASHELKTPLNSMKILTESILYEDNVEESVYKEFLGDIDHEVDRMTNLVNDMLLMTRLQNMEKKDLVFEEVSVISLLEEVVGPLRRIAESKEITLKEEYGYTGNVSCISGQLQHAIQNLIENAIKYNHEGGSVTVGTKEENGEIVFYIDDDGEGIPEAEQEKIFERFYRVSKSRARETGGSGLGLYIVQTIVRLHGGRITLESAEGEGSTFYIHLPKKGNDREKE